MFKIVGILLLCLTVILGGYLYCWKLSFRKKYLEGFVRLSENCAQVMRSRSESVFDILKSNAQNELVFLDRINSESIADSQKVLKILESGGVYKDDINIIKLFLQGLGTSDIEGQKNHCGYYSSCFSQQLANARKEANEKGRLVRSLCFLAASALFIILI